MTRRAVAAGTVFLVLTAGILILGRPILRLNEKPQRQECAARMKVLLLVISQYARDYDEFYPKADNFKEAMMPYAKDEKYFNCSRPGYGMVYNRHLAGLPDSVIMKWMDRVPFFYDAPGGFHVDGGESYVPAGVHMRGTNAGFLNRNVKLVREKPTFWIPEIGYYNRLVKIDERLRVLKALKTNSAVAERKSLEAEGKRIRDSWPDEEDAK